MNREDLAFLVDHVSTIDGRRPDRLAEVQDRIRSARRRRAAGAIGGALAAVLAIVISIAALLGTSGPNKDNGQIPPVDSPTKTHVSAVSTTRPIVYADGVWPMRKIHLGDQTVDISGQLPPPNTDDNEWGMVFLQVSSDGVVLVTHDGRIWFTDGNDVVPIGQLGYPTRIITLGALKTGMSGSIAAWVDASQGWPEMVVYDTSQRAEVARIACPKCGEPEIAGSHVYWSKDSGASRDLRMMFDPDSGETRRVPATAYAEDLASHPRALIVGDTRGRGQVETGLTQEFLGVDGHLVALADPDEPGVPIYTKAWDTGSGRQLVLRVPAGYDGVMLRAFDWLDDDRMALEANYDSADATNDILVCRISTGSCHVAVPGTGSRFAANIGFD